MLARQIHLIGETKTMERKDLSISFEPLTSQNWAHFVELFSRDEHCRQCWCLNHRVAPKEELVGEAARDKMQDMVARGEVGGLLAYIGESCVAWAAIDSLGSQLGHDYLLEGHPVREGAWAIHCIYIAPEARAKGLSKDLIRAGIQFARAQGARSLLSFPIPPDTRDQFPADEAEFSGRYSSYVKMSFKEGLRLNDFYQTMEFEIKPSADLSDESCEL